MSAVDVWSLGVCLINMLTLDYPFPHCHDKDTYIPFLEDPSIFFKKNNVHFEDK